VTDCRVLFFEGIRVGLTEKGEYVIFTLVDKSLKANKRLSGEEFSD
jgi:hypothetical protein